MTRVLLASVGEDHYVGAFFQRALEELGHEYTLVDEGDYLKALTHSLAHKAAFRLLGRRPLTYWSYNRDLLAAARRLHPEIVLVTKGAFISPDTLTTIKKETGALLVNYATDDPFNPVNSTRDLKAGIPRYDLYACTKRAIMEDVRRAGCPNVTYVPFAYEPTLHFPEQPGAEDVRRHGSDVVFVGTGDKERLSYFGTLVESFPGIRFHLYGDRWQQFPRLRPWYRGPALGKDYRMALSCSKIALGLLRKANRDAQTMRSFEIPACGAFMLAERTDEHLDLFREGEEAAYFTTPDDFVDKVRYYLANDEARARIADAGYKKVTSGGHTYKDRLEQMLKLAEQLRSPAPAEVGA